MNLEQYQLIYDSLFSFLTTIYLGMCSSRGYGSIGYNLPFVIDKAEKLPFSKGAMFLSKIGYGLQALPCTLHSRF